MKTFIPFNKSLLKNSPALVPIQNDARPVVIKYILQYLQENENHCCFFEDATWAPSDQWVKHSKIKYFHLDEEMYYFFGNDAETETFEDAFKRREGYYFLCALSSLRAKKQNGFSPFSSLSSEQLDDFASNVISFFVPAYDGEGYLQWRKEGQTT